MGRYIFHCSCLEVLEIWKSYLNYWCRWTSIWCCLSLLLEIVVTKQPVRKTIFSYPRKLSCIKCWRHLFWGEMYNIYIYIYVRFFSSWRRNRYDKERKKERESNITHISYVEEYIPMNILLLQRDIQDIRFVFVFHTYNAIGIIITSKFTHRYFHLTCFSSKWWNSC